MRIQSAETHRLCIPLNREYRIAGAASSTMDTILVILETENGELGIGTADPVPGHPTPHNAEEIYTNVTEKVLPDFVGTSVESVNQLRRRLQKYDGFENAMCAVEMACLDLLGRSRGETLTELLGGPLRDEVRVNAWVGVDSPESMAEEAEHWRSQSFESLKMKVSGDPSTDVRRITSVCEAVGDDMEIRVDANEGYAGPEDAISVIDAVDHLPIEHFEQPIVRTDLESLKQVTEQSSITILADEPVITVADAHDILARGAADRIKFKILKSGGVLNVKQGLDLADAANTPCVLGHGFCTAPGASAEYQLAAAHDNVFGAVETVGELKIEESPFRSPWTIENGRVSTCERPGLGVELDRTSLDEVSRQSAHLATESLEP